LLVFLSCTQSSWADLRYSEVKLKGVEEAGTVVSKLVVEDTQSGQSYETEPYMGMLERIEDFDGDGNPDALLSLSCLGSGCPSVHRIVSLKNGILVSAEIPGGASNTKVKEEGGRWYLVDEEIDTARYYGFDGKQIVFVKTVQSPKTIAEVRGPGIPAFDEPPRELSVDMDGDKKPERIVCDVWDRWGSLFCHLPLPGGGTQRLSLGCVRMGVLPSFSNGYHEMLCDFDIVIRFDGEKWVERDGVR